MSATCRASASLGLGELLDAAHDIVPVLGERRELANRLGGELRELLLHLAELADRALRELEPVGDDVLGRRRMTRLDQVPRAGGRFGLDHDDVDITRVVHASGNDHVERALLDLLERGVRDPRAALVGDPDAGERPLERQAAEDDRHRRAGDREDVGLIDLIGRQDRGDDVDLVPEALREGRAQRPVDQAGGEDRGLGRTALATEERAGDLPDRVHALLDVDRQREEVEILFRLRRRYGGDEDLRVVDTDDNRAVGELRELPRLERVGLPLDLSFELEGCGHMTNLLGRFGPRDGLPGAGPLPWCGVSSQWWTARSSDWRFATED